ncbi:hypothetical protein [Arcobacter arenosus]|jgi:hypothetical protein|uniref:Uncharacterized protein n=1 Tax=Arcobacter arenosus TaxID=2576037 RepID=A0A5R8Y1H8_9BACT|nr:hypothetical protein [Arcobacter arenosus]TLP39132.1 hypothetical protein FDK22_04465 [Arcobacter arenosus]
MKNIFLKFIVVLTLVGSLFILNAKQGEKFILILKESNINGKVLYKLKDKLSLNELEINNSLKRNYMLQRILEKIFDHEDEYTDEELFFVDTLIDKDGNEWTLSVNVLDNNSSVSQFISKKDDLIINGWINRNNKDIFGLKIFNF